MFSRSPWSKHSFFLHKTDLEKTMETAATQASATTKTQSRNKLYLSRDNVKLLFQLIRLRPEHTLSGNVEDAILEQLASEV